jgi:hypothetical protein
MIKTCIGLHVKYPLFLSDLNKNCISSTEFQKHSNIKFDENPSNGSRVVPCGQTDGRTGGKTDMTERRVAFRNLSYSPKNDAFGHRNLTQRHLIANTFQQIYCARENKK